MASRKAFRSCCCGSSPRRRPVDPVAGGRHHHATTPVTATIRAIVFAVIGSPPCVGTRTGVVGGRCSRGREGRVLGPAGQAVMARATPAGQEAAPDWQIPRGSSYRSDRAAVFRPTGAVVMDTSDDYASLAVTIGPRVLEDALAATRAVAAPLHEAVVHGLLRIVEHPFRDELDVGLALIASGALRTAGHRFRRCSCTNRTAAAPSPTADATRRAEPLRTSPAAKTPGRLVSRDSGGGPAAGRARSAAAPVST